MTPPKKAAKKVAKKAAAKHAHHDDDPKEIRRAYEHLGRIGVLHGLLEKTAAKDVADLIKLAEQELASSHMKHAAELLRTAEHISFGHLNPGKPEKSINPALSDAINHEFERKLAKATDRWSEESEHDKTLEVIYTKTVDQARQAFDAGAFRKALELARGAEALTHVKLHGQKKLGGAPKQPKLTA